MISLKKYIHSHNLVDFYVRQGWEPKPEPGVFGSLEPEPEPIEKKSGAGAGTGAAKKFAGSPALCISIEPE